MQMTIMNEQQLRIEQAKRIAQLKQQGATPEQIQVEMDAVVDQYVAQQMASSLLSPESTNALLMQAFANANTSQFVDHEHTEAELKQHVQALKSQSPLARAERLLISQAESLNTIFCEMAFQSASKSSLREREILMRVALKAQSQCRATLDSLAGLKQPSVVFAKTANIAQHQQINQATNQQINQPNQQTSQQPTTQPLGQPAAMPRTSSTTAKTISQQTQTALPIQTVLAESLPIHTTKQGSKTPC